MCLRMKQQGIMIHNQEHVLQTPTAWESICGAWFTLLKSRSMRPPLAPPNIVGEYTLLSDFDKKDGSRNMSIGLYQKHGKKYVIKQWVGVYKDLSYYTLVNEYVVNRMLFSKEAFTETQVRIPQSLEYFSDDCSLTCVFEYIEGIHVQSFDDTKQAQVLQSCLQALEQASLEITAEERRLFGQRRKWFYGMILCVLPPVSLFVSPRIFGNIVRSSIQTLRKLLAIQASPSTIAHRDLTPSNILMQGDTIYIMDTENLLLTFPGYDYAFIACAPELTEVTKKLVVQYHPDTVDFLKKYIILHNVFGSGAFMKENQEYIQQLQR